MEIINNLIAKRDNYVLNSLLTDKDIDLYSYELKISIEHNSENTIYKLLFYINEKNKYLFKFTIINSEDVLKVINTSLKWYSFDYYIFNMNQDEINDNNKQQLLKIFKACMLNTYK